MSFNAVPAGAPPGFNGFVPCPDGNGGTYLEGTFELMIIEATGVYRAFQGVTITWSIDSINSLTVNSMNSVSAILASVSSRN
jgi:hypothetical protein